MTELAIGIVIGATFGWIWHHKTIDWLQEKIQKVKIKRTVTITPEPKP